VFYGGERANAPPACIRSHETARHLINISLDPWRVSSESPYPQIHSLSNGRYSLLISASGSGFSRWNDIELTR
jgi:hypothetical protein